MLKMSFTVHGFWPGVGSEGRTQFFLRGRAADCLTMLQWVYGQQKLEFMGFFVCFFVGVGLKCVRVDLGEMGSKYDWKQVHCTKFPIINKNTMLGTAILIIQFVFVYLMRRTTGTSENASNWNQILLVDFWLELTFAGDFSLSKDKDSTRWTPSKWMSWLYRTCFSLLLSTPQFLELSPSPVVPSYVSQFLLLCSSFSWATVDIHVSLLSFLLIC